MSPVRQASNGTATALQRGGAGLSPWAMRVAVAASIAAAVLIGVAFAASLPLALGICAALSYLVLVFVDLELAIALWVPLVFLEAVPELNLAGKAAGLALVAGWIGSVQTRPARRYAVAAFTAHRRGYAVLIGVLVWVALTALWAVDPHRVVADLWHWALLAVLFLIIATSLTSPRALKLTCGAFVSGAVVSVAYGQLTGAGSAPDTERLAGGAGDPNFLAASLVSAVILASALAAASRSAAQRWLLLLAAGWLMYGLVATESRGGVVAGLAAMLVALVVFRGLRLQVLAATLIALGVAFAAFMATPTAWERIVTTDSAGTGRTELWTVAWRAFEDRPVGGVGVTNFVIVSPRYVRESGQLENVRLIAVRPHVALNTYLEMLAETGIVGLALFTAFVLTAIAAAGRAARVFDALARDELATLARAVIVAVVAMLVAGFFLSSQIDKRLWLLLALGPALLAAARRDLFAQGVVRRPAPAAASTPAAPTSALPDDRLVLNTATAAELQTLVGLGPVVAGRIVEDRERDGPYRSVEDLERVAGIGPARVRKLSGRLRV
jgi:competence ComEA-like helix-hairpin-helix protein